MPDKIRAPFLDGAFSFAKDDGFSSWVVQFFKVPDVLFGIGTAPAVLHVVLNFTPEPFRILFVYSCRIFAADSSQRMNHMTFTANSSHFSTSFIVLNTI